MTDNPCPIVYLEAISKLGFSFEIKARPRINPPRLTGSSTRILKYVEDLRRGLNADIERKDFFEMAYRLTGGCVLEKRRICIK
jgi:hypothetical protein